MRWVTVLLRQCACSARQSCNRRCRVRNWEALNRPGWCSSNHSIIVVAFSWPLESPRSRGSISSSHTPSKGSGRVRHQRSCLVSDGNGPSCHLRADRTHIPAFAAAVSCVFPSISFCLHSATCRSLINPAPPSRMVYSISTGKSSRRMRHSLLSSITSGDQYTGSRPNADDHPHLGTERLACDGHRDPRQPAGIRPPRLETLDRRQRRLPGRPQ